MAPAQPFHGFEIKNNSCLQDAFRAMQAAKHKNKVLDRKPSDRLGRGGRMHPSRALMLAIALVFASHPVHSALTAEEAAQLGTKLTPLGADPKGNAEGTIPP